MPKEITKRAAYKSAEVCEIAHIQPYVLRSWESEFPRLGVVRSGTRIYRQADLEQVLRIKQLVFDEGLTLAGARRRLEDDTQPQPDLPLEEFVTPEFRERIVRVRRGLEELLSLLGGQARAGDARTLRIASVDDDRAAAAPVPPRTAEKTPRQTPPAPARAAAKTPRQTRARSRPKGAHDGRRHT